MNSKTDLHMHTKVSGSTHTAVKLLENKRELTDCADGETLLCGTIAGSGNYNARWKYGDN